LLIGNRLITARNRPNRLITSMSERGTAGRLQLVSSEQGLSALIRADGVTIQIENGTFAVATE
jgi:hypothetical protein